VGRPERTDAGMSVEAAVMGTAHWAVASVQADTLFLVLDPAETEARPGLLVRALLPAAPEGPVHVRIHDQQALPLLHADGIPASGRDLPEGQVLELITTTTACILQGMGIVTCPPHTIRLNSSTCVDVSARTGMTFYEGATHCARQGGKLCSWDDHIAACVRVGTSLTGLFDDWEWINDTSNHTHTVDQAGRTTCLSQRSAGPNLVGGTRCCYRAR
jgi:hypothetical protein